MAAKTPDRRVQRTRKLLQDALIALVLEKGYEAVTIQDIIDRANVGRSTFYAHFLDKQHLFLSGFEQLRQELADTNSLSSIQSRLGCNRASTHKGCDNSFYARTRLGIRPCAVTLDDRDVG